MEQPYRNISLCAFFTSLLAFAGCGGSGNGANNTGATTGTVSYVYSKSIGAATGVLTEPDAIALDNVGNILVANFASTGISRISKFDANGNFINIFGNAGTTATGLLSGPQGVNVDANGNVYVADSGNQRIVKFNSNEGFVAAFLAGQVGFPYQINEDSLGNLYVAAAIGTNGMAIKKFSSSGALLATIGNSGPAGGILSDPDGVAFDKNNNMYVADFDRKCIVEYNSAGVFMKVFGNSGSGQLAGPQGVYVASTGKVFVADLTGNRVVEYDSSGNFVQSIGASSGAGLLSGPYDVNMDLTGNLLVVDEHNNRVAVFAPSAAAMSLAVRPSLGVENTSRVGHH